MKKFAAFLPLFAIGFLALIVAVPLMSGRDLSAKPSPLIGRAAPALAHVEIPQGGAVVVNFFASWCAPCIAEHPWLMKMSAVQDVAVIGVAYKDKAENTGAFLDRYGNPFGRVVDDAAGAVAIDWGVTGVPETFVIRDGVVVFRHAGPLTEDVFDFRVLPLLAAKTGEQ